LQGRGIVVSTPSEIQLFGYKVTKICSEIGYNNKW
jgi:hypothetical protein